jgi:hypothetical protein
MRGSERSDPKSGPLENMSQAYFAHLDRINQAYEPALKGIGRYNLELAGLTSRRAQAWIDIPSRLGRCKTPQDLWGEQTKFWQTAMAQYTESWQRMAAALGASSVLPGLNGAFGGKTAESKRDIITFADAPEQAEDEAGPKGGRRRAA